jgi:hypothetical protein
VFCSTSDHIRTRMNQTIEWMDHPKGAKGNSSFPLTEVSEHTPAVSTLLQ